MIYLGQVKATDLDQGENARIYYYLISDKSVPFIVDRLDGTIYANETLDREKKSSYEIIIKASNNNEYQETNVSNFFYDLIFIIYSRIKDICT